MSGCQFWQADKGSIAQRRDGFQCHVSGALGGPLIILFQEQRADESHDSIVVGEDADDIGTALDLAIEALERVGGVDLALCWAGKSM